MNRHRASWPRELILLGLAVIGIGAWRACDKTASGEHGDLSREALCPSQDSIYAPLPPAATPNEVPLAGNISLIAGFHDCQRLVSAQDTAKYGPLTPLWVAQNLDALPDSLAKLNPNLEQGNAAGVTGIGLAFAELYAWDGNYDALGIKQGWNCLYLFPSGGKAEYGALMVPVTNASACLAQAAADTLSARPDVKLLYVHTDTVRGLGVGDYPAVGRWEWDAQHRAAYIGLGCHDRWCAVTSSATFTPPVVGNPGPGHRLMRVWRVQGWFDQQALAVPARTGLRPGSAWGTVVPDSGLDARRTVADFRPPPGGDPWIPVAEAALSRPSQLYKNKLNLDTASFPHGAPPARWADIALCTGEVSDCFPNGVERGALPQGFNPGACNFSNSAGQWWSRTRVGNGPAMYRCVRRVDHSSLGRHIPGVVRWVWDNADEKANWLSCAEGCCQEQ